MAIKAIFGAQEFDWRDIKFYYNPITSLLEPIGRSSYINNNLNANPWWINSDGSEWFAHSEIKENLLIYCLIIMNFMKCIYLNFFVLPMIII